MEVLRPCVLVKATIWYENYLACSTLACSGPTASAQTRTSWLSLSERSIPPSPPRYHLSAVHRHFRPLASISLCGRLSRARAASPLQRVFCLHSAAIAKSPGADIVEYKWPHFQYPRHHRARNGAKMSSSEDDTPRVKAKNQGEFGDDIPRKHRRFHARRGLLSRDEPSRSPKLKLPFSFTTVSLHPPPSPSTTLHDRHD
jgi:hypothetical protein